MQRLQRRLAGSVLLWLDGSTPRCKQWQKENGPVSFGPWVASEEENMGWVYCQGGHWHE